jgi:hypothetical protein
MYALSHRRKCIVVLEIEMNWTPGAPELVCLPSAIASAERQAHFALARELFDRRAEERTALSNGYVVRFHSDVFEAVARFVANERKCCPFMSFELTISPDSGPLWLRMTGPEGTRSVLDAELNLAGSCGCG